MKVIDGIKLAALSAALVLSPAQAAERTLYLAGYGVHHFESPSDDERHEQRNDFRIAGGRPGDRNG